MNWAHHWICRCAWWRRKLTHDLVPWVLNGYSLGARTLEIGPGPGLTSEILQHRSASMVCVELDVQLACGLRERKMGNHVHLVCGDAAALPLASESFDSVVAFTMLHHVKSAAAQDALFREAARILRPGGVFAGTDSRESPLFRLIHWGDTMQMINPDTLSERLHQAGFVDMEIECRNYEFRFFARRAITAASA
jgi:SAM-dependent methyltransferase